MNIIGAIFAKIVVILVVIA